jgi:hypothetical protein
MRKHGRRREEKHRAYDHGVVWDAFSQHGNYRDRAGAYQSVEPSGPYRREDEEAIAWLSAGMGRASFARRLRVEI